MPAAAAVARRRRPSPDPALPPPDLATPMPNPATAAPAPAAGGARPPQMEGDAEILINAHGGGSVGLPVGVDGGGGIELSIGIEMKEGAGFLCSTNGGWGRRAPRRGGGRGAREGSGGRSWGAACVAGSSRCYCRCSRASGRRRGSQER